LLRNQIPTSSTRCRRHRPRACGSTSPTGCAWKRRQARRRGITVPPAAPRQRQRQAIRRPVGRGQHRTTAAPTHRHHRRQTYTVNQARLPACLRNQSDFGPARWPPDRRERVPCHEPDGCAWTAASTASVLTPVTSGASGT
jgi:hypothetical protein